MARLIINVQAVARRLTRNRLNLSVRCFMLKDMMTNFGPLSAQDAIDEIVKHAHIDRVFMYVAKRAIKQSGELATEMMFEKAKLNVRNEAQTPPPNKSFNRDPLNQGLT